MGGMSSTEAVAAMRFEKMLAGVLFTGDCVNGIFTRGKVCCPNCKHELEQKAPVSGDVQLICPQINKGCVKPTKTFRSRDDLEEWVEHGWDAMTDVCKQNPNAS
jgi:hypothetical protein